MPGDPPLTIYPHLPTPERPWLTLRSAGVSDRAMAAPEAAVGHRYAELFMYLPGDWELSGDGFWPVRLLKQVGRFPHQNETWLSPGDTVAVSEPGEVYAPGTNIAGALLLNPTSETPEFGPLEVDGVSCQLLWVIPITEAEMALKLEYGAEELVEVLHTRNLNSFLREEEVLPMGFRVDPAKLLADLLDHDEDVREAAVMALGSCGPQDRDAVPVLAEGAAHAHHEVRFWAVTALGRIGPGPPETVPALIARLRDPVIAIRQAATKALAKIGPPAATEAIPELFHLFVNSEKWSMRVDCSQALRSLGAGSPELVHALINMLADPNEHVRGEAAIGLEHQGKQAMKAIPLLERMASDDTETEYVRLQSSQAAKTIIDATQAETS